MKDFLEKNLEDIIMDNKDIIHEKGFEPLLSRTFRQYKLPSNKIIDIVSAEPNGDELLLHIIELKKDDTTLATLIQAYGYLSELLTILSEGFKTVYCKVILVGKDAKDIPIMDFLAIPTEIYTYKYGINGIMFNLAYSNALKMDEDEYFIYPQCKLPKDDEFERQRMVLMSALSENIKKNEHKN